MFSPHPVVPFDAALIDDIASRMDLRVPNRESLEATAKAFDGASGEPFEVVCDLATAVGKTYLAGGLVEYLAAAGIRNFLIVTPGRTILNKTVANFTDGHPKSILAGMETRPFVITAENFNTGNVAAALRDDGQVKLFVFTVQALVRPDKSTRRVRKHQEWLGEDLYRYLQHADDLVVLADEHHVYRATAKSFSSAVRDLDPMAVVGLTATPDKADLDKVIYQYALARAIADKYVKTPVLVGRKDDASGVEIRLRDGLLLLAAKQRAADAYADVTGKVRMNAVMFVIADTIDNANAVADVLKKPGMFPEDYDQRVLVVHSDAPDDALARLDAVEDPASPVRVIVSVSMLKEGWDVKNIYVICSLRPSISDVLTEQTLGRGLRLPWGAYTGVELLDTVEVLSHERYEQLLAKAGVLLEGLTETRAALPPVVEPLAAPLPGGGATDDTITVTPGPPDAGGAESPTASGPDRGAMGDAHVAAGASADLAQGQTGLVVTSLETRFTDAAAQAEAVVEPVKATSELTMPKVTRTVVARSFSLSNVRESPFRELGRALADEGGTKLNRKRLDVISDPTAPTGYRLVPSDATEVINASAANLPFGGAQRALFDAILQLDIVDGSTKASLSAIRRFVTAIVDGAGSEDALAPHLNAAIAASQRILTAEYKAAPEVIEERIETVGFAPTRINSRFAEPNRFGPFTRKAAYTGWKRSLHPVQWFDSNPERTLGLLFDGDDEVAIWARIQRGELTVEWKNGRYSPDFYASIGGLHYLFEVKADKDVATPLVQAKKKAAEDWARFVTDNGDHGTWKYLLVPESVLATAKTVAGLLNQTGGA